MYQMEELSMQPYFEDILKETSLSTVLDSLTGVVSRSYMLEFIHFLVDSKQEFTVGMIDLDNFKSYNDNYGHTIGDKVLTNVADSLIKYVGSRGVVGRFGGDEFLVVAFIGNDYHRVHDFYENMFNQGSVYNGSSVFRRDMVIDHLKLFISATLGSASFPKDAQDYDTLFSLIDKTLYRGKFKGRNCYIIYVPQKHAHLEIPKLARHSLYDTFVEMAAGFDAGTDMIDRLQRTMEAMHRSMRFHFLFLISPEGQVTDVAKNQVIGTSESLGTLAGDGYFACGTLNDILAYPRLIQILRGYDIHSFLLMPYGDAHSPTGFLLLSPEPNTLHIWQDEEIAAGFVLVRFLKELPEA